jgi:hypothetical protein
VCTAGIELPTVPPERMQAPRFACPSDPPTIHAAHQGATSLEFKAPHLTLCKDDQKIGLRLLTPAVQLVH